jgi:hypothetical protein
MKPMTYFNDPELIENNKKKTNHSKIKKDKRKY